MGKWGEQEKRVRPLKEEKQWDGNERRGVTNFEGIEVAKEGSVHMPVRMLREREKSLKLNNRDFGPRGPEYDVATGKVGFYDRRQKGRVERGVRKIDDELRHMDERKSQIGEVEWVEGERRVRHIGGKEIREMRSKNPDLEFAPWEGPHKGFSIADRRGGNSGRRNRKNK